MRTMGGETQMTMQEYITANAKWLGERVSANLAQIPDAALPALVAACNDLGGGDEPGIDCDVIITHESLADFDASRSQHWSEPGVREEVEYSGFKAVSYERLQLRKGTPRVSIIVVDIGDKRVALQ